MLKAHEQPLTTTMANPTPIVFDMETQDPDDFLTLLLLLGHPACDLRAVTIMPGSTTQVGLVRRTLTQFGHEEVRVGSHRLNHPKRCVSSWHERAFGAITPSDDAEDAATLLMEVCDETTTLVTGAPLKNLEHPSRDPAFRLGRWVAQGGFAGVGVVPPELQLAKFAGRRTCPTFNFNGAPKAAMRALEHPGIAERYLVSKNVCHGVVWDEPFHAMVADRRDNAGDYLRQMWDGMEVYLARKRAKHTPPPPRVEEDASWPKVRVVARGAPAEVLTLDEARRRAESLSQELVLISSAGAIPVCTLRTPEPPPTYGKKLHDPLAACCAIDPDIGTWREVRMFREQGEWGAELCEGTSTWIIIDIDRMRFADVLTGGSGAP